MNLQKFKVQKRKIRHKRARARIFGVKEIPRLSVFRSNKYIYVQAIDDETGSTVAHASDFNILKEKKKEKKNKTEIAKIVGLEIAKKLKEKTVSKIIFDRGGYKYHGCIKALAEGAREGGINF